MSNSKSGETIKLESLSNGNDTDTACKTKERNIIDMIKESILTNRKTSLYKLC